MGRMSLPRMLAVLFFGNIPMVQSLATPAVGHWFFVDGTEIFADSVLEFLGRIQE